MFTSTTKPLQANNLTHPSVQRELMAAHVSALRIARSRPSARLGVSYAWIGKQVVQIVCYIDITKEGKQVLQFDTYQGYARLDAVISQAMAKWRV